MSTDTPHGKIFKAIEGAGGFCSFDRIKRQVNGYGIGEVRQAITDMEEAGRIAILLCPKGTVFYASQARVEEAR